MAHSNLTSLAMLRYTLNRRTFMLSIAGVFLAIVILTLFQDFLESRRVGYVFYLAESLLFKITWFLHVPILLILRWKLQNQALDNFLAVAKWIGLSITVHLCILPFLAVAFSIVFFDGVYDLFKFFTYALTHHLWELIAIYTGFVMGYSYLIKQAAYIRVEKKRSVTNTLIINNGKDNVIVQMYDIIQITAATPYVSIHLEERVYLYSGTLKSIYAQLGDNTFVRVHKSALVNIAKVRSFQSRLNGDYDLLLTNGSTLRLSRTYAADFKQRFVQGTSG